MKISILHITNVLNISTNGIRIFVFLLVMAMGNNAYASQLTVAVASNFNGAMKKITVLFSQKTGVTIKPVYASTGKLYAMIENGGPFDLFLAADTARPTLLYQKGLAHEPFVYATGKTVLWTNINQLCPQHSWQKAIKHYSSGQVAIANPELAPYGKAAMDAISMAEIPGLKERFVYGQNVAQAFSFAHKVTGIGFTAASLVLTSQGKQGCYWPVEQATNVEQSACVLARSAQMAEAEQFASFLVSDQVKTVLTNFGYSD